MGDMVKMSDTHVFKYTDSEIKKGGDVLRYPNTKLQKFMRFPFGAYYQSFTFIRAVSICWIGYAFLWYKTSTLVRTPENYKKFEKIHAKRFHSRFDPIHE